MEYKGKLYGKVGKTYFPLLLTAGEVDQMQKELTKLRNKKPDMIVLNEKCIHGGYDKLTHSVDCINTDCKNCEANL